jgi:hypothetical protein
VNLQLNTNLSQVPIYTLKATRKLRIIYSLFSQTQHLTLKKNTTGACHVFDIRIPHELS